MSDLLPAYCRRSDVKPMGTPRLLYHIFHHILRHRTAADIAVADEQDFYHTKHLSVCRYHNTENDRLQREVSFYTDKL